MSIFSQSAERAARAAPNGVKKWATFLLVFRCLNHTASSRKAFYGVQKGQGHSKKHKPSKKYFLWTIDFGVGCISWDATSGGWPLRVRKFRVENDWNHAKFVWTCGADGVDVRGILGRPTLVICLVDRCAGACLQAQAGLGDTTWRHLTDSLR